MDPRPRWHAPSQASRLRSASKWEEPGRLVCASIVLNMPLFCRLDVDEAGEPGRKQPGEEDEFYTAAKQAAKQRKRAQQELRAAAPTRPPRRAV